MKSRIAAIVPVIIVLFRRRHLRSKHFAGDLQGCAPTWRAFVISGEISVEFLPGRHG